MPAQATIHHIAHDRRRGGVRTNPPGALNMPSAEEKLDHLVEMLSDVRVDVARLTARSESRDEVIEGMRADIEALKARPQGLTGRQLMAALASAAGLAAAIVSVLDKVHIG